MKYSVTWTVWLRGPVIHSTHGKPEALHDERTGNAIVEHAESTVDATAEVLGVLDDSMALLIAERKARGQEWKLSSVVLSASPLPDEGGAGGETFNLEAKQTS